MKLTVRFCCAVLGIAAAVGAVVFARSLVATNDAQALAHARRLVASVPVPKDAQCARFALDYRPNGHVMQGPPMMVFALAGECEDVGLTVTRALFAQRRLPVPKVGTELVFIGEHGTYKLKIDRVIDGADRPMRGFPNVIMDSATAAIFADEAWRPYELASAEELAPMLMSDAGRNMDRAKPLLLWAAALTALCLLVNSLSLSIEANRRRTALLRVLGLTRGGVVRCVLGESLVQTALGLALGIVGGLAALALWVKADATMFPSGMAVSKGSLVGCAAIAFVVAVVATLVVLRRALTVRPLEAVQIHPSGNRRIGMMIAFACGFGAFVAVEVWGSSLMSSFVPSKEWPDAIVSLLPNGVSAFDIDKLQGKIKGVAKLHELQPFQANFEPEEELPMRGGGRDFSDAKAPGGSKYGMAGKGLVGRRGGPMKPCRNVLLLASDWLPHFKFVEGSYDEAKTAIDSTNACVITSMMARARKLKKGDHLVVKVRGLVSELPIAGIVDLNWHMVTSRGLVRGLNRMPVNTDGPAFVSFDTVDWVQGGTPPGGGPGMTHVWLSYEPDFLAGQGVFPAGRLVEEAIRDALGDPQEVTVRLHARDEIADGTLAHGDDIVGSMARVPFIFLAVLSIGFIAMLVAVADARQCEFALLRAVGATRGQLVARLFVDALKTAVWGLVIGFPCGALAGWLFTSGTRAAMAQWGLPPAFAVPCSVISKSALGALAFALAVALPASYVIIQRVCRR